MAPIRVLVWHSVRFGLQEKMTIWGRMKPLLLVEEVPRGRFGDPIVDRMRCNSIEPTAL